MQLFIWILVFLSFVICVYTFEECWRKGKGAKKLFIFFLFMVMSFVINAQNAPVAKKKPFVFPTEQKAIGMGVYQKDSVIKSIPIKIYVGSRGGRYYVVKNSKDNSLWDRKYLKKG